MAQGTVRVKGLRELQRAFGKISKDLKKETRDELRAVGNLVTEEARSRFMRYDARSASGFKTRVRQKEVTTEQSRRRTTGKRPDYGALQMRRALLPALAEKEDEVVDRLDKMLGRLGNDAGF